MSEHGGKVVRGPLSESMYTVCSTQLTTGLACTLSITREYMEHGGRLPANCVLTVYYLPVYPPYSDFNYGLCSTALEAAVIVALLVGKNSTKYRSVYSMENTSNSQSRTQVAALERLGIYLSFSWIQRIGIIYRIASK